MSIQWMVGKEFKRLTYCRIFFPHQHRTIHPMSVTLPVCDRFYYRAQPLAGLRGFFIPSLRDLDLQNKKLINLKMRWRSSIFWISFFLRRHWPICSWMWGSPWGIEIASKSHTTYTVGETTTKPWLEIVFRAPCKHVFQREGLWPLVVQIIYSGAPWGSNTSQSALHLDHSTFFFIGGSGILS